MPSAMRSAVLAVALLLAVTQPTFAFSSACLWLTIDGNEVQGDFPVPSLGRAGTIEVLGFTSGVQGPRDPATGRLTGRHAHEPIVITKPIDKSSPLLAKALTNGEPVEGTLRLYRAAVSGNEENFFTIRFTGGYITSLRFRLPSRYDPVEGLTAPSEEVSFIFRDITWTYEPGGIMHHDSVKETAMGTTGAAPPATPAPKPIPRPITRPQ